MHSSRLFLNIVWIRMGIIQVNSLCYSWIFKTGTNGKWNCLFFFETIYRISNGLTVVNFSNSTQSVTLDLTGTNMKFTDEFNLESTYWVNDLYNDTSFQILGSDLANFQVPVFHLMVQQYMQYLLNRKRLYYQLYR